MKKGLLILLAAASVSLLAGCHEHTYKSEWNSDTKFHWKDSNCCEGERDSVAMHSWQSFTAPDGTVSYACSVCGYAHQHTYDAQTFLHNSVGHWHPVTCGHADAPLSVEAHNFLDGSTACSACGFDENTAETCEVAFAYVVVDDKGQPVVDSEGSQTEVGVTYTVVTENGGVELDPVVGGTLYAGDKLSFTVKKSVFCYYTDNGSQPLVEIISRNSAEETKKETLEPDTNGVYTVTLTADTVISVANVATSPNSIKGKGTQDDPFTINSVTDWLYFSYLVNDKTFYNFQYNVAYWQLNVDLDFEGETIYVVGDGFSTQSSVFCGNFNGNGHKITNFVLDNSVAGSAGQYSRYLGLFGVISSYEGVDTVIKNLTVENFTINAVAASDDIVSVGGLIGNGVGANVKNCVVRNATIQVSADDTYMSYAGGLVGYMQSGMSDNGIVFYSSVGYSAAENITIKGSGMLYDAGGIVGRAVSANEQVTSFIYNCYSTGSISDAVRSGGIAGEIQRYSSVQNCYSTAKISAHSTFKEAVVDRYAGTALDDRYSYAGGIVGYAENDTVVANCFYDGKTLASAAGGVSFAKSNGIVAGTSEAGFSDYTAQATVLSNNSTEKFDGEYLKETLKWSEIDWVFSETGYPVINPQEGSHKFNFTVKVGEDTKHTTEIDSTYLPMAYWYIIDANKGELQGIPARLTNGATQLTYGYFFDEQLTQRVPTGYVPMSDMTVYAEYVDTNDVVGKYYFSNGGVAAKLTLKADGTYEYEEGAVLVDGAFDYNGKLITLKNCFFSRMAETATDTQKVTYYTFWAEKQENGNLHLFDCEEQYVVTEDDEAQSSNFVNMARFFERGNPLIGLSSANVTLEGGYYYIDGSFKNVFLFNYDLTGTHRYYDGEEVITSQFEYEVIESNQIAITIASNGRKFTAVVEDGAIISIADPRGSAHTVTPLDAFAGVWEKEATSHKVYTFDGMGNWTYEHFTYLTKEDVVNAVKHVVVKDKGTYVVDAGVLQLVRADSTNVIATLDVDGAVLVQENGGEVEVKFANLNSHKGVWYTAGNKVIRYKLALNGLNQEGIGTATISGFTGGEKDFRYIALSEKTLHVYMDDLIYAVLTFDAKLGVISGMFYDKNTGTTSSMQTFYLYDDFHGEWVSDIEGLEKLSFNGFGAYNKKDATGASLAVNGLVTIDDVAYPYTLDRATDSAKFTYQGVEYSFVYNEYTDSVQVTYGTNTGVFAKADKFAKIVFVLNDTTYSFDGRGNFANGGKVTVGTKVANYKINVDGSVSITGEVMQTIQPIVESGKIVGYELADGTDLSVQNAFSGSWAISQNFTSVVVGKFSYLPESGEEMQVAGSYNGEAVTMYYNGNNYVYFDYQTVRYYLIDTLGGNKPVLIFSNAEKLGEEGNEECLIVPQDSVYGEWKAKNGATLEFDGCGDSNYTVGSLKETKADGSERVYTYSIKAGVVTLSRGSSEYATFVACDKEDDGAYENSGRYYKILLKVS